MIRPCREDDLKTVFEIINDGAKAYKGLIPAEFWQEPYMPLEELRKEVDSGVVFWGLEREQELLGVMGIQDKFDVALIRHAYVRTNCQQSGIGTKLLKHLDRMTEIPIIVGTWAVSSWAISFYQKNGFCLVSEEEKNRLLRKYWSIPELQVRTSVVLAKNML